MTLARASHGAEGFRRFGVGVGGCDFACVIESANLSKCRSPRTLFHL